jgi:hypothetical protein
MQSLSVKHFTGTARMATSGASGLYHPEQNLCKTIYQPPARRAFSGKTLKVVEIMRFC